MLELRSIVKSFHDGESRLRVLRGVDLLVNPGESVALVGASGSGKTTLLQIAAGLDRPDEGAVRILDKPLAGLDERGLANLRRRRLGFVFQRFNLLPGLDVEDNLLFQRRLNRLPDSDPWIDELVEELGLAPLMNRSVDVLSSGQQQRVAIGRALAHRPRIVFADEPTGNLHDTLSRRVMALLVRLVDESEAALLLVTHNREMAAFMSRRLVLAQGRLREFDQGPVAP